MQFFKVVRPDILSMGKSFVCKPTSAVHFWEITRFLHILLYSKPLRICNFQATSQRQRWSTADNLNMLSDAQAQKNSPKLSQRTSIRNLLLGFESPFENSAKNQRREWSFYRAISTH